MHYNALVYTDNTQSIWGYVRAILMHYYVKFSLDCDFKFEDLFDKLI